MPKVDLQVTVFGPDTLGPGCSFPEGERFTVILPAGTPRCAAKKTLLLELAHRADLLIDRVLRGPTGDAITNESRLLKGQLGQ